MLFLPAATRPRRCPAGRPPVSPRPARPAAARPARAPGPWRGPAPRPCRGPSLSPPPAALAPRTGTLCPAPPRRGPARPGGCPAPRWRVPRLGCCSLGRVLLARVGAARSGGCSRPGCGSAGPSSPACPGGCSLCLPAPSHGAHAVPGALRVSRQRGAAVGCSGSRPSTSHVAAVGISVCYAASVQPVVTGVGHPQAGIQLGVAGVSWTACCKEAPGPVETVWASRTWGGLALRAWSRGIGEGWHRWLHTESRSSRLQRWAFAGCFSESSCSACSRLGRETPESSLLVFLQQTQTLCIAASLTLLPCTLTERNWRCLLQWPHQGMEAWLTLSTS